MCSARPVPLHARGSLASVLPQGLLACTAPPGLPGPGTAALSPTAALAMLLVWSVPPAPERRSPGCGVAVPRGPGTCPWGCGHSSSPGLVALALVSSPSSLAARQLSLSPCPRGPAAAIPSPMAPMPAEGALGDPAVVQPGSSRPSGCLPSLAA